VTTAIQNVENYLGSFTDFEKTASGRELPWLRTLRAEAFARFCETGFPTTHDEDWRFTNVSTIARAQFALEGKLASVNTSELKKWRMEAALEKTRRMRPDLL